MESIGLLVQEKKRKIDFQDGGHLGFPIGTILAIFDKSPRFFLASLESIGLLVQEKQLKIDFQDGRNDAHLGFSIGTILAIFYLQVTLMLPTKYRVNWPFGSGGEAKNRFFQDGGHLGFPIGMILAIFDLQVTPMLPTKYRVSWPRGVGGVGF